MSKNARLSDVSLGTSAAPTYFPVHYFETKDAQGKIRTFDLVDGAVAANNPVSIHLNKSRSTVCILHLRNFIRTHNNISKIFELCTITIL